ncbi:MAG: class I SAM-dependent methyltransferase [Flavobacteriia bacterium]|nr:class I SAM-dependent methyltransferase [Flavobacteriia bacterium]OJX37012.1 MAG: methyltransferase [Flavobacteriia bacterium 40-80]
MKDFWNERYSHSEFAYGEEPNEYLKEKLTGLQPGTILFPAEGEGRNAVYAAILGWNVSAFDQSEEGRKKAELLSKRHNVEINYIISDVEHFELKPVSADALALIYAHFPGKKRREYHQKLAYFLKPGGTLIIEGFSKKHSIFQKENSDAGGPGDPEMLYSLEELKNDFPDFDFTEAYETETELNEGIFHTGKSSIIRITGIKG